MVQKIEGAQRDFSFGEIDVALKRSDDHPARKAGLRQMSNARILNSGSVQDRSGRRALFPISNGCSRIEKITMSAGNNFKIAFGAGRVQILDHTETIVANFTLQGNGAALPWASTADIQKIEYALFNLTITICFGNAMRPQVITWDGVSTWSIADYTEAILTSGQKRTPFYRISPQNVTALPSATTGVITVTYSSPICVAGMAGTRILWCGRQILLTSLSSTTVMNALVIESLPPGQQLTVNTAIGDFAIGDVVEGTISGAQGIVTSGPGSQNINADPLDPFTLHVGDFVTGGTSGATGTVVGISGFLFTVILATSTAFTVGETITGGGHTAVAFYVSNTNLTIQLLQTASGTTRTFIGGSDIIVGPAATANVATATTVVPQAVSVWDDEIINALRGYPASCFVDQFRMGFTNFPAAVGGGIAWSAINSPTDLYANAVSSPDNAIFEIAPNKVQVYFVVPGPEGSEFVFCDTRIYYIPISTSSPLAPGSVGFQLLSGDGAAQVKPRISQEAILYVNAGQNSVFAVIATGAYNKPFNTKNLCEFHQHLFASIQCIAAPNADGTFLERYVYVLNANGSIAVGKYNAESLQSQNIPTIGWGPWSGGGAVSWIGAWNSDVLFTTSYFGVGICEVLDDTQYLDGAVLVNSLPAPFTPPGGKGPLYLLYAGQTVTLMDQVTRMMGTYNVDANGNIVPQFNGGENLAIASLVAGQPWTMTVEPFCPDAAPGNDVNQRMMKRRISRFAVYVINSTGFLMARLFAGPITPTSQANSIPLGTVMNQRRVPAWNQGDNPTLPPPLREEAQRWRPLGRAYDPRVAIIKDTPGPLMIQELAIEATI